MTTVALAVMAAVLSWPGRPRPADRLRQPATAAPGPAPQPAGVRRPFMAAAAVGIGALLVVGAPWWLVAALVLCGVWGARSRRPDVVSSDEVPVTADLMAACLHAGAGVGDALAASLVAAGPWVRASGERVVAALRAGEQPEEAWRPWLDDSRLAPIARTCIRTAGSGATAAAELARVAARLRVGHRMSRQQRVARASVWIVLPLGTCFLPAFVAVGVVPLVVSLVAELH